MLLADTVMDAPKIFLVFCSQHVKPSVLLEFSLDLADYVSFMGKSVGGKGRIGIPAVRSDPRVRNKLATAQFQNLLAAHGIDVFHDGKSRVITLAFSL